MKNSPKPFMNPYLAGFCWDWYCWHHLLLQEEGWVQVVRPKMC
jgi:hypothetical protein